MYLEHLLDQVDLVLPALLEDQEFLVALAVLLVPADQDHLLDPLILFFLVRLHGPHQKGHTRRKNHMVFSGLLTWRLLTWNLMGDQALEQSILKSDIHD